MGHVDLATLAPSDSPRPRPSPEGEGLFVKDFALSEDPAVQRQLDRLGALRLPQGQIGLEMIRANCSPASAIRSWRSRRCSMWPGTNGKGSTCAYLRAMLEAEGLKVHVATKPHLVRYNERIRHGRRADQDALLASLLEEVLDASDDLDPSFFEVTTVATFLAFQRIRPMRW